MSIDLLGQAASLLTPGGRRWPRGAAFLTRIALEEWVRSCSATIDERLPGATMRSQLLCLELAVGADAAARARHAWHSLSEACHHHAYDLTPSPLWIADLVEEVRAVTHPA